MMQTDDTNYTTELFSDKESAEQAYKAALNKGYSDEDISVLMSEDSKNKYFDSPLADKASDSESLEGAGVGGAIGAAVGGTLAAIAAMGTNLVMPGLGLVVAGPLAAGLAGAGAGSISGGLIGALIGWGIPKEKAIHYEQGIKDGGIVLSVKNNRPNAHLDQDWNRYKANTL